MADLHKRVTNYWVLEEGWNWDMIEGLLPSNIENKIVALALFDDASNQDSLC